jgi:hypothetical protein
MTVVAACEPVESGSPNMAGVQAHLGFDVGMVPEGCEPLGLSGDGRGTMVGATFECDLGTILIERFDSSIREDDVPAVPAESGSSEIEWRDGATRDVIRLRSDGVPIEVLFDIADSIHILDD